LGVPATEPKGEGFAAKAQVSVPPVRDSPRGAEEDSAEWPVEWSADFDRLHPAAPCPALPARPALAMPAWRACPIHAPPFRKASPPPPAGASAVFLKEEVDYARTAKPPLVSSPTLSGENSARYTMRTLHETRNDCFEVSRTRLCSKSDSGNSDCQMMDINVAPLNSSSSGSGAGSCGNLGKPGGRPTR